MDKRDLKRIHPAIPRVAEELQEGRLDRREFLRTATLLGLSAGAAYALAGRITGDYFVPRALADTPKKGGTVKIAMRIVALDNPATFSWIYDANVVRQTNEYLTRTGVDNITRP